MPEPRAESGIRGKRGFVLLATAAGLVAMVGALGLSVDLGRLYIARNEAQSYADAAALAAALELDGTSAGIVRARDRALALPNRWHLGTASFTGTEVDFATSAAGPWLPAPSSAVNYRFVRVRAAATASLYFIPVVAGQTSSTVRALAVAAQVPKTNFNEGILPFSPMAHDAADPNFGFTPGQRYTLRWGANPKVGPNVCPGDNHDTWVTLAEAGNASERGYIEETSSAVIRMAIEQNYQSRPLAVGDTVVMTGGNKQTQRDSLINRINQDTDKYSATYAEYVANDTGNGRRLVVVPINTWYPEYRVLGFAAFFLLLPSEYPQGGNKSFCAEYVGPFVQGSRHKGAGGPGAYVVRLVQ
ncbi:MAG TPA: pilus assembly protein TadG-related protein [Bryobacteraceae bacterium]|nr:pilus assembly protein TadG-related protein [Bryobacteraceae bacterium]